MQDQYETRFGIFNHYEYMQNPFASVMMHRSEDSVLNSSIYEAYEEFAAKRYHEIWGLDATAFFDQPQWKVRMMREIADAALAKRATAVESFGNLGLPPK